MWAFALERVVYFYSHGKTITPVTRIRAALSRVNGSYWIFADKSRVTNVVLLFRVLCVFI